MKRVLLTALTLGLMPAVNLAAQDSTARRPVETRSLCFHGRPLPRCSAFWLTEFGVGVRLTRDQYHSGPLLSWEAGLMKNHGTRNAFGGAIFAESAEGGGWGIRGRYRRWLSPLMSVDLAPGYVPSHGGTSSVFSGHVALNVADYAAVTAVLRARTVTEYIPAGTDPSGLTRFTERHGVRTDLFLGGRLGALPGLIVGIAVPSLAMLAFVIACSGGGCFD